MMWKILHLKWEKDTQTCLPRTDSKYHSSLVLGLLSRSVQLNSLVSKHPLLKGQKDIIDISPKEDTQMAN